MPPLANDMKLFLRELLPRGAQVPAKYWYLRLNSSLERELDLLPLLVRAGDRVADVGGNRGIYAYRLWQLGARVDVFEPNPACADVLGAWAAGKSGVRVHAVGLSNREGEATLHIPVDRHGIEHDASASVEHAEFENARNEQIVLRTLDSYAFEDVQLIKIDVEGHEASVLDGARATLTASRPALLVEIEQRHCTKPIADVFLQIVNHGYRGFFFIGGRMMPLERFDPAFHQSARNFGARGRLYVNNFLFLAQQRLDAGEYRALLATGS